ncbi:MAG: DUF1249 domain-containing protein [Methylococcaceae bacterium]|jgi:uncharacterized protein YqiB (DUF1249 family)|nr:DUF1249 domain-containing protein [Methylococcaceae bacterium]
MSAFTPVEKSLCLQKICEANYGRLARLVPDLLQIGHAATARVAGKPALHLRVLERSPFTLELELTHDFEGGQAVYLEPAVRIRVCLDARTVEMLCDAARPLVHDALRHGTEPAAVLDYKWSLNYFLSRWLDHCIAGQYRFGVESRERQEALLSV